MRYLAIAAAVIMILAGVIFSTAGKKMMQATDGDVPVVVLPEADSAGAGLFKQYCAQCHGLPEIDTHTADDWPRAVERMMTNMSASGQQMPSEAERDAIDAYLVKHAK
jgi:mono/diheme cytochrome c family protein